MSTVASLSVSSLSAGEQVVAALVNDNENVSATDQTTTTIEVIVASSPIVSVVSVAAHISSVLGGLKISAALKAQPHDRSEYPGKYSLRRVMCRHLKIQIIDIDNPR